jgi:hypothetical protein
MGDSKTPSICLITLRVQADIDAQIPLSGLHFFGLHLA